MVKVESVDYTMYPKCPICGTTLSYKDTKKRRILDYGAEKETVLVRRLFCSDCNKIHTELPSFIFPRKHYKNNVIKDVLDYVTNYDDPIAEDGPANITMKRWRKTLC